MNRLSSSVKLDPFMATLFPMSSDSLNLSGLVSAQIVRLLKSGAFCMTRFIALSPVGSPTSDTMTIMLLVFFSMYSKTKSWVTRFMRGSSLAKWAPGRSTKVRVVNSGPGEEEIVRSRNDLNSARYIKFKFQNGLRTSIELNEGIFKTGRKQKAVKKLLVYFTFTQCELLSAMIKRQRYSHIDLFKWDRYMKSEF